MNHNYIIILFLALFLTHVKKTFRCHPAGEFAATGAKVQSATFSSGQLILRLLFLMHIIMIIMYTDALDHFTIDYRYYYNSHVHILHDPKFVNDHYYTTKGFNAVNPYTLSWNFDPKLTPPKGAYVTIYVATIYWGCNYQHINSVWCYHQDIVFQAIT